MTATRVAQPLTDVVADVSIVDRETIERGGATGLSDVLARVPGIEFARNGGPGASTSVYLRGGESRFTAVYIDGVRVDTQTTGGASWEAIPLDQVDRIEILRGPAAAVYGSDAIAGVIQIFTRKGEGPFKPYVGVGLGSDRTRKLDAGFSGASGPIDYSLGLGRELSDGFNAKKGGNPDRDGYDSRSANGRLGWQLGKDHRVEATLLAADTDARYDSSLTKDDHSLRRLETLGLHWQAQWTEQYRMKLAATESRDRYETTPSPYLTQTRLRGYLWHNEWRLGRSLVTAALESKEDHLDNAPIDASRSQDALALGYGWRGDKHSLQLNARHDDDSEFGGRSTGSVAYGYAFAPSWRATASAGNAFRAPTLYQRFSAYGVPTLQPESSRNLELGVRWAQGSSSLGLVAYRNRVSNLINFSDPGPCASSFGCYANTARAKYEGLTISGAHKLGEVNLGGSLDLQDPKDLDTGRQLARRARRHAALSADTLVAGWTVGAEAQLASRRNDSANNSFVLAGYGVVNLYTSRRLARDWSLLARVDNLADKDYELARNYATGGRRVYLGMKWSPQ